MKDIGERLTAYEPLWENWYKETYLGSGGSGKVYKFRQELYGQVRWCAVKVLPIILDRSVSVTHESREQEIAERKKQVAEEIKNMYLLGDKPHLVHCINHTYRDIISDEGEVIGFDVLIQMEYYKTLTKYINEKGVLPPAEVEKLARQIGEALQCMHGKNMLHRDIKPDNIFVDDSGEFYLGDFGIAKQTQAGSFATFVGTQPFMAPEVWNSRTPNEQHYGTAADIYSLGITLYYLLNGNRLPMVEAGDNRNAIDAAIFGRLSGKVFGMPENGSEVLKQAVMDCCAYDPADRLQTAEDLLAALDRCDATMMYSGGNIAAVPMHKPLPVITEEDEELPEEELPEEDFEITDSIYARPGDPEEELIIRPAPERPIRRPVKQPPAEREHQRERQGRHERGYDEEQPREKERPRLSSATKKAALTIGIALCCIIGVGALFFTKTICIHNWLPATCTKPATCTRCGKTRGELAAHVFEEATCTHPMRCTVCGEEVGDKLEHSWQAATCTQPKTCAMCGATEGEALGHKWKDADCEMPQYCEVCGLVGKDAVGHKWKEATCTAPKTCTVCKKTEGEALGHEWKEATCTEPKTCERCGETSGKALGHQWVEATLTTPKTCSVCGATEGTALDYTDRGTMFVNTGGDTLALREEKSASSRQLASIPDCTEIRVWYTGSSGWYYALYDNTYGYVNSGYISATDPMLGDGTVSGWDTKYLDTLKVSVTSAEVKNGRLNLELDVYNDATEFVWPDLYIYYNGSDRANGNFMELKDVIIMPYTSRSVTATCKVDNDFGRGSLKNIVVVDGDGNKVLLEPV
ncbi:serine/threonine protein kinase [Ruminococcus sp.]|uniref:serine/threonine protein kinase n=1 Tax=Ruminococcus sp. TaxID=41978 RepID=UPI0025FBD3AA|nr:serine/threonine protein kinase [Ruminococcus sp.]MBQ8966128.1 protein kinase [Ruminococcus sp.]